MRIISEKEIGAVRVRRMRRPLSAIDDVRHSKSEVRSLAYIIVVLRRRGCDITVATYRLATRVISCSNLLDLSLDVR